MMRAFYCALFALIPAACLASAWSHLPQAALALLQSGQQQPRVWADSTGRFKTQAVFVARNGDSIVLRKTDGVDMHVPLTRLSGTDRRYVDQATGSGGNLVATAKAVAGSVRKLARAKSQSSLPDRPASNGEAGVLPADLVYLHVSANLLRRQISRPVARQSAVAETIVGTPVSGTAGTAGMISLHLVPSHRSAIVDLLFHGQIQSQTTGFGGPVQVHSGALTKFSAIKRVVLDEQGIEVLPAQVAARTSTSIQGVSTSLPRLRGRIARRIGQARAMDLKSAAEAESARKAEARIGREFDRDVARELTNANSRLAGVLAALPMDARLFHGRLKFTTSAEYLQLAIHRDGGEISPLRPPSPAALGSPDLAIHIRTSAIEQVVRNTDLQRRLQPLVNMLLAKRSQQLVGMLATVPQPQLKQSADGQWWSLVVPEAYLLRLASHPPRGDTPRLPR